MGAVAEWWVFSSLALAKANSSFLGNFHFFGLKACAFVRAVAKGSVTGFAAAAPPVGAWF